MVPEVLVDLGLSPEEADIYISLLEKGPQSAGQLAKSTKVKRTYIYSVAGSLTKKGLISQNKNGKTTFFSPMSPDKLASLVETKKQLIEQAENTLESIMPSLKTKFEAVDSRPVVNYFEGIGGLKKVYQNILKTKKDIILYRSIYDNKDKDVNSLVEKQILDQVKLGIRTRTITPIELDTKNTFLNLDRKRLVERHIISSNFDLPAQLIIYGTKTAIISLKKGVVATIIDNEDITRTFEKIFELIWELSKEEHNKTVASWK